MVKFPKLKQVDFPEKPKIKINRLKYKKVIDFFFIFDHTKGTVVNRTLLCFARGSLDITLPVHFNKQMMLPFKALSLNQEHIVIQYPCFFLWKLIICLVATAWYPWVWTGRRISKHQGYISPGFRSILLLCY